MKYQLKPDVPGKDGDMADTLAEYTRNVNEDKIVKMLRMEPVLTLRIRRKRR